ncbi:stage 0 sporulation family protein [Parasediminibacterium sp. JCM 36343]|uniref:PSP1 domain-containing protein n=1 Tax=Parasediminibacterium sp. JCM 36343 TaxID=3374279 RepID=UPI0039799D3E
MGCGSCGTGKPNGCKSNGGCSTGGCNRMNVHDWLVNLPFSDVESTCKVIEVSFKQGSRKEFFRNTTLQYFEKGDYVTVEGIGGFDVGEVSLSGELVRMQLKKRGVDEFSPEMKRILRPSMERDLETFHISKGREAKTLARSREIAIGLKLQMKLSEIEIQADGKKATFFYTADDRVDFREMIKMFAAEFKLKVEMRQIGIRQEAAKMGGIGSCGRELCCSTWLTDFKSVNTTAARYQNLSINQTKLSGQCGRLKCCLNFELDTYLDALQQFPENADTLETSKGNAFLIKKDIFKNLMWYILQGSSRHYPLSITRVREIKRLNGQGVKPDDLEPIDLTTGKEIDVEPEYADVVGQISLKTLEKSDRKKRDEQRSNNRPRQIESRGERPSQPQQQRDPANPPPARENNNNNAGGQPNRPPQNNRPPRENNNNNNPQQRANRPSHPPRENNGGQQQRPPQNRPQQPPRDNSTGGGNAQRPPQNRRPPRNNNRPPQQGGGGDGGSGDTPAS